jgi:ClpP class serine protease
MVCLGSDKIVMSPVSELGPIDPQIPMKIGDSWQWVAAHHVIKTYDNLMKAAVDLQQGHIEPYLQQLAQFNSTQIEMLRSATKLSCRTYGGRSGFTVSIVGGRPGALCSE